MDIKDEIKTMNTQIDLFKNNLDQNMNNINEKSTLKDGIFINQMNILNNKIESIKNMKIDNKDSNKKLIETGYIMLKEIQKYKNDVDEKDSNNRNSIINKLDVLEKDLDNFINKDTFKESIQY